MSPSIHSLPIYGLDELFAAYGFTNRLAFGLPNRPARAHQLVQTFACHVAASFLEVIESRGLPEGDGVFVPSPCDTLNNLADILAWRLPGRFVAAIDFPEPGAAGALEFLTAEIGRVKARLLEAFGLREDRAAEQAALAAYAQAHGQVRAWCEARRERRVSPSVGALARFWAQEPALARAEVGPALDALPALPRAGQGPTLMVSGIVLPPELADALEGAGLRVIDDDLAQGYRRFSGPYPALEGTLEEVLARKFLALAPCSTTSYGPHRRAAYVAERVRAARPDGFLFLRYPWCEPEAFDAPPVLAAVRELGVAVAEITLNPAAPDDASTLTRVEAFRELLTGRASS